MKGKGKINDTRIEKKGGGGKERIEGGGELGTFRNEGKGWNLHSMRKTG